MEPKTRVKQLKVKNKAVRLYGKTCESVVELPPRRNSFGQYFMKLDLLMRNLAVVGGLALVIVAVRNSSMPQAQSVFGALQESIGMKWDENVGKLSFVNTLIPDEIQEVWCESPEYDAVIQFTEEGEIVHAWSTDEPYWLINSESDRVHSAVAGEVMSIAHGKDKELVIRIRHSNSSESVYGNLSGVCVEIGDSVAAGAEIGKLLPNMPLAFEFRENGCSVSVNECESLSDE